MDIVRNTVLHHVGNGRTATVLQVCGGRGIVGRLEAMGIRPGVTLSKISGRPLGGPVVVQINGSRIAMGFGMAGKVLVEVEDGEASS